MQKYKYINLGICFTLSGCVIAPPISGPQNTPPFSQFGAGGHNAASEGGQVLQTMKAMSSRDPKDWAQKVTTLKLNISTKEDVAAMFGKPDHDFGNGLWNYQIRDGSLVTGAMFAFKFDAAAKLVGVEVTKMGLGKSEKVYGVGSIRE